VVRALKRELQAKGVELKRRQRSSLSQQIGERRLCLLVATVAVGCLVMPTTSEAAGTTKFSLVCLERCCLPIIRIADTTVRWRSTLFALFAPASASSVCLRVFAVCAILTRLGAAACSRLRCRLAVSRSVAYRPSAPSTAACQRHGSLRYLNCLCRLCRRMKATAVCVLALLALATAHTYFVDKFDDG
jgi:hypothetical protein